MKYLAHVPTEQYGYISVEVEGEAHEAVEAYKALQAAWSGKGTGIPQKDWTRFLDAYIGSGKPPEDGLALWEEMSDTQRLVVNEVKKTLKRLTK